jgi:hypothetical protein
MIEYTRLVIGLLTNGDSEAMLGMTFLVRVLLVLVVSVV